MDRSSDDGNIDDTSHQATRTEVSMATVHATATPSTNSGREGDPTVGHDLCDDPIADRVDDIHDFCSTIFKSVPEPLLPRPTSSPTSPPKRVYSRRTGRKQKNMVASRSSVRLAAHPSTVPVAERATRKLMRELDFLNNPSPAPDAAVTAYVDMYADDLPEQAVMAIRAAMRLSNKELAEALATIAQETGEVEMEVP
jgi:hypothetical protein